MNGNEGQIHRGRGLVDLIADVTPTPVDWTVDPTDPADITDGDISTFCTTGSADIAAWACAYFEWDLGAFYNVFTTGFGHANTDAGSPYVFVSFYNGASWSGWRSEVAAGSDCAFAMRGAMCSKVRIGITAGAIATITPNIREFHVWRL